MTGLLLQLCVPEQVLCSKPLAHQSPPARLYLLFLNSQWQDWHCVMCRWEREADTGGVSGGLENNYGTDPHFTILDSIYYPLIMWQSPYPVVGPAYGLIKLLCRVRRPGQQVWVQLHSSPTTPPILNLQRGVLGSKIAIKAWFANTFPMIKM